MISRVHNCRRNSTLYSHRFRRLFIENLEIRSMFASDLSIGHVEYGKHFGVDRTSHTDDANVQVFLTNDYRAFGQGNAHGHYKSQRVERDADDFPRRPRMSSVGHELWSDVDAESETGLWGYPDHDSVGTWFENMNQRRETENRRNKFEDLDFGYQPSARPDVQSSVMMTEYIFASIFTSYDRLVESSRALLTFYDALIYQANAVGSDSFRDHVFEQDELHEDNPSSNMFIFAHTVANDNGVAALTLGKVEPLAEHQENVSKLVLSSVSIDHVRSIASESITYAMTSSSESEELCSILGNLTADRQRAVQLKVLDGVFEELETNQYLSNQSNSFNERTSKQRWSYDTSHPQSERTPIEDGLIVLDLTQRMVPKSQLPTLDSSSRMAWSQRVAVGEVGFVASSRTGVARTGSKQDSSPSDNAIDHQLDTSQRAIAVTVASVLGLNWLQRKRRERRLQNAIID